MFQSSLIYNTSARHKQHDCDTSDTSGTNATQVQHEWDMNNTSATRVQHKCYTNNTNATGAKKFDFDNDTSENTLPHPYNYYMTSERLQGEEQFYSKNYLLKRAPQKLNFVMAKAISKGYTLDCSCKFPCMFPHSYP